MASGQRRPTRTRPRMVGLRCTRPHPTKTTYPICGRQRRPHPRPLSQRERGGFATPSVGHARATQPAAQGDAPRSQSAGEGDAQSPLVRLAADRRRQADRSHAERGPRVCSSRASFPSVPLDARPRAAQLAASRSSDCPTRPTRRSRATWRPSSRRIATWRWTTSSFRPGKTRPGPTSCSSTAGCSNRRSCGSG